MISGSIGSTRTVCKAFHTLPYWNSAFKFQTILIYRYIPMPRFVYSRLNPVQEDIRLISLPPGHFEDSLDTEIFHTPLSESHTPDYGAVSYVWGSVEDPETILRRSSLTKGVDLSPSGATGVRNHGLGLFTNCVQKDGR